MSGDKACQAVIQAVQPGFVVAETAAEIVFELGKERLRLRKVTPAERPPEPLAAVDESFYDRVLADRRDRLGELVLEAGEPCFESVSAALPRLRDVAHVGVESELQRFAISAEGLAPALGEETLPEGWQLVQVGLLDGYLPVFCHLYETPEGLVERLSFASAGPDGPLLRRRTRLVGESLTAAARYECAAPSAAEPPEFWGALLETVQRWRGFVAQGLRVELPEEDLLAAAQAMLVQGVMTFRGLLPRYGMGGYDQEEHHSFPPAVLFLVQGLLAWGHVEQAGETLSHYLSRYLRPDGTLDYYGPAVAEYGQLLALVAEYVALSGQQRWLGRRVTLLRPVWERLVERRAESLNNYPPRDPRRGLIPGLPEADYHQDAQQWQRFYYSGDVWAARGLQEIGQALQRLPELGLVAEGTQLVAEALDYRRDIEASVRQVAGDTGFVPPAPDQLEPLEVLTANRHASYCNYRYYPEMLSAGVLPSEFVRDVILWRRAHGGELLGMTRFEQVLDDWPALHHARGLLEQDEIDAYLLLLYAHWAHHCAEGTLASYEQVQVRPDRDGLRRLRAGQVLPCQVMVPVMLRWALVYEQRDAALLWLGRAMPRRWLEPGQKLAVKGVPTAWGTVGFSLKTSAHGAAVKLRLPKAGTLAEVRLVLRAPGQQRLRQVTCEGQPVPFEGETVRLVNPRGKLELQVEWE